MYPFLLFGFLVLMFIIVYSSRITTLDDFWDVLGDSVLQLLGIFGLSVIMSNFATWCAEGSFVGWSDINNFCRVVMRWISGLGC